MSYYICQDMATALVTAEDVNVVIVDWRGGSLPLYSQAAANTRLVGMEVARMVEVRNYKNKCPFPIYPMALYKSQKEGFGLRRDIIFLLAGAKIGSRPGSHHWSQPGGAHCRICGGEASRSELIGLKLKSNWSIVVTGLGRISGLDPAEPLFQVRCKFLKLDF